MTGRPGVRRAPASQRFARAGRRTNVALLTVLAVAFVTGWLGFATSGSAKATLVTVAHGAAGLAAVGLVPWKQAVIRRATRWRIASLALLAVVVLCLVAGFVQVFGGYGIIAGLSPIQVHVGAAVVLVVLLVVHLVRHRGQRLRPTDLTRRRVLGTAAFLGGTAAAYAALEGVGVLSGSRAATRISTGSHRLDPSAVPPTIWLFDRTPRLTADHRVRVGGRVWSPAELDAEAVPVRARLDCTSGWYADVEWTAVPLDRLLGPATGRSIVVTSATGYRRRFALAEASGLWLATGMEGARLGAGHGGPARLVAPGYRGFWWVKWVSSVEVDDTPVLAQSPFPLP